jgi:hypothetical protein
MGLNAVDAGRPTTGCCVVHTHCGCIPGVVYITYEQEPALCSRGQSMRVHGLGAGEQDTHRVLTSVFFLRPTGT